MPETKKRWVLPHGGDVPSFFYSYSLQMRDVPDERLDDIPFARRLYLDRQVDRLWEENLPIAERIEYILMQSMPNKNVRKESEAMAEHYGSYDAIVQDSPKHIKSLFPSVTQNAVKHLQTVLGDHSVPVYRKIISLKDMQDYLTEKMFAPDVEQTGTSVWQMLFDGEDHLLADELIADDLGWGCEETMSLIRDNIHRTHYAKNMILVIADYDREIRPERYDKDALRSVSKLLSEQKICLLDCIFFHRDIYSMNRKGLFEPYRNMGQPMGFWHKSISEE